MAEPLLVSSIWTFGLHTSTHTHTHKRNGVYKEKGRRRLGRLRRRRRDYTTCDDVFSPPSRLYIRLPVIGLRGYHGPFLMAT